MRNRTIVILLALAACAAARSALAWGAAGHVLVTRLAVAGLPEDFPAWVKQTDPVERLCYLCVEPDRWRGQGAPVLDHINNPDHYFDVEDLDAFGQDLMTLPRFRNAFIESLAAFRALHPDAAPVDAERDKAHVYTVPGLLPYAIEELRWKIASSWSTLRALEAYPDVATTHELDAARNNVLQYMGLLSHFVGDAHQPLHLSRHHHGWIGPNPGRYTRDPAFHGYIDGAILDVHAFTFDALRDDMRPANRFDPQDSWDQVLRFLKHSNDLVEPLYRLEKSGQLIKKEGRAFIADRLLEAGANLAGLWVAAWRAGVPDPYITQHLEARRALSALTAPSEPPNAP